MTYTDITRTISDTNRRSIAEDLAQKLDALNDAMKSATEKSIQGAIQFNAIDKDYQANMRLYLLAQKQFFALLPPQSESGVADALIDFNNEM